MKNLILLFALTAFGITAMAQAAIDTKIPDPERKSVEQQQMPAKTILPNEYVIMTDGKLWHFVDSKKTEITKKMEVVLNGTKVKGDGSVILKDGKTTTMKEGNIVNALGRHIDVAAEREKAAQKSMQQKPAETVPKGE